MNEIDVAWAAGFLEGEGCFGWYGGTTPRKDRPNLTHTAHAVISCGQNDREPLDRLMRTFGAGRLNRKRNSKRLAWEWRCQGKAAIPVMEAVLPHMSQRRQERIREVLAAFRQQQAAIATKRNSPTCKNGHLWAESTGYRKQGVHAGKRYCLECSRESARRANARKKAATS